jgi:hypothetical protein
MRLIEQPFSTKMETVLGSNHMQIYCTPLYSPTQRAKQRLEASRVAVTKKIVPLLGAVNDLTITDD